MINKKLVAFASMVFVVGLVLSTFALRQDFSSRQYKTYPVQAEIVHAYFKVYNASADSGIGNSMLISYVFVLNLTNPSDSTLKISEVMLSSAGLFHFRRDFGEGNSQYYFYPHTSRLVAFSQTDGTYGIGVKELESLNPLYILTVGFSATEGRGGGSALQQSQLPLRNIGQDEFVYGATYKAGLYFFFSNENIDIGWGNGRES